VDWNLISRHALDDLHRFLRTGLGDIPAMGQQHSQAASAVLHRRRRATDHVTRNVTVMRASYQ
jgi:hypothetical protein